MPHLHLDIPQGRTVRAFCVEQGANDAFASAIGGTLKAYSRSSTSRSNSTVTLWVIASSASSIRFLSL